VHELTVTRCCCLVVIADVTRAANLISPCVTMQATTLPETQAMGEERVSWVLLSTKQIFLWILHPA
jgi:hypothetical protein